MDISMIMAIPVLPSAPINYGDDRGAPAGSDVRGAPAGRRRRPRGSGRPAATSAQLNLPQNTWPPGSGQPEATTAGLRPAGGDVRGAPAGHPHYSHPTDQE